MSRKRPLTVAEILELLEKDDDEDVSHDPVDVVIQPPENACDDITDEDSGDEDSLCVDNLSGNQLRAEAEMLDAEVDDKSSSPPPSPLPPRRKKARIHKWTKSPFQRSFSPWTEVLNSKGIEDLSPVEIFSRFFSDDVLQTIADESNRYATQRNRNGNTISIDDIKSFIGVLLLSGYVAVPRRRMFWEKLDDTNNSLVSNALSRDKFEYIMSNFHVVNNNDIERSDRFAKVRPLFNYLNKKFRDYAPTEENHSIDEAMVPYYGRHGCKQFIRGKPIRYGYKLWVGASRLGYVVWMEPYQGSRTKIKDDYKELGLGASIVLEYSDALCSMAKLPYHLYFDNFFTSIHLLEELERRSIKGTGTVRENRTGKCPLMSAQEMKRRERGIFDYRVSEDGKIILCRWHDNSVVTIASNACPVEPVHKVRRYSQKEKKNIQVDQPHMIHQYNKYMGGVDRCDQNISLYRISIRGKKWYFPLLMYCIDLTEQNSWQLHKHYGGNLDHLEFRRRIVLALLSKEKAQKCTGKPSRNENIDSRYDRIDHLVIPQDKQTRCRVCHTKCLSRCVKCNMGLHVKCFVQYHTKK